MGSASPHKGQYRKSRETYKRLEPILKHNQMFSKRISPQEILKVANIPEDQWKLPVAYSNDGHHKITLVEWTKNPEKILSLATTSPDKQRDLVIERLNKRSDFSISSIGESEPINKKRAIAEIQQQTPLGRQLQRIELRVIDQIFTRLSQS